MYHVKLTYSPRYGWSGVLYIRGKFMYAGDFSDTLAEMRARINDVLQWNGLL